jgi:hypothetical protein
VERRSAAADRLAVVGTMIVAVALIASRRPDAVLHPQFWAEDGTSYWRKAYTFGGLHVLFLPQVGYLQLFPRLVAAVFVHFPLQWVPASFNLTGITVQALPAALIVSRRLEQVVPDRRIRIVLAFLYLAVPASSEIDANLVNSQWHLAVLAALIVIIPPPGRLGRVLEVVALVAAGLSGPFSLAVAPVALIAFLARRSERWRLSRFIVVAAAAVAQLVVLQGTVRSKASLGATPGALTRLLGNRLVLTSLLGSHGAMAVSSHTWWRTGPLVPVIVVLGLALVVYALVLSPLELRLFILFACFVLAGSLADPLVAGKVPAWLQVLPGRYFVIPIVAVLWLLVWLVASRRPPAIRVIGAVLLVVALAFGVRLDWEYPPYRNLDFAAHATQFDRARPGQLVTIPENPGGSWKVVVVKK